MQNKRKTSIIITIAILICSFTPLASYSTTLQPIKVMVDGNNIQMDTNPLIYEGRTLVPIRFVSEALGATVEWSEAERSVKITKNNISTKLVIDSKIVAYDNETNYGVSDVEAKIVNSRTLVPIRVVANALGTYVEWNESNRTVIIDSSKPSNKSNFFEMKFAKEMQSKIQGRTEIYLEISDKELALGNDLRLILIDKTNHTGFEVDRKNANDKKLVFTPKMEDKGDKIIVAALYDKKGKLVSATASLVNIDVMPNIGLIGASDIGAVKGPIKISPQLNFIPRYVDYVFENIKTGKEKRFEKLDPFGELAWNPGFDDKGDYNIYLVAYDNSGNSYKGTQYKATIYADRVLSLSGVSQGQTVSKPVTLIANRNFAVSETTYLIKDVKSGKEEVLTTIPYGGYNFYPGPEFSGLKDLKVIVKDPKGEKFESEYIRVNIDGTPSLFFTGIGPKQVVTLTTDLKYRSNVILDDVKFEFTNKLSGEKRTVPTDKLSQKGSFTPVFGDKGEWSVKAIGKYNGNSISSETVGFKIYTGKLYGPTAIVAKNKFLDFASNLAVASREKTGMSAAIQTAQAILETGWGQSVPTDKYNGKISNNLFGIKGSASNGSVISNTWEVYNGVTYRVDAEFRAYKNAAEAWDDHKALLLKAPRYQIFRDVMFDSSQAAWAVRRAGYATDPAYSLKLLDIIKNNNLLELDRIKI